MDHTLNYTLMTARHMVERFTWDLRPYFDYRFSVGAYSTLASHTHRQSPFLAAFSQFSLTSGISLSLSLLSKNGQPRPELPDGDIVVASPGFHHNSTSNPSFLNLLSPRIFHTQFRPVRYIYRRLNRIIFYSLSISLVSHSPPPPH